VYRNLPLFVTVMTLVAASTLNAQQPQLAAHDSAIEITNGTLDGARAAQHVPATGWLTGSFFAGVATGFVGLAAVTYAAQRSHVRIPAEKWKDVEAASPPYRVAFETSFAYNLRSRRTKRAILGGAIGCAVTAIAVYAILSGGDAPAYAY